MIPSKLKILANILLLLSAVVAHDEQLVNRAHHHHVARQQLAAASSAAPSPSVPTPSQPPASSSAPKPSAPPASSAGAPPPPPPPGSGSPTVAGSATSAPLPDSTLTATDPSIPPLSAIVSNEPSQAAPAFTFVPSPGAPGPLKNGPAFPTATFNVAKYPSPTELAPTNGDLFDQWMSELESVQIPDIPPTTLSDTMCDSNAQAAADPSRCWWTCGGCTRSSDIFTCLDKGTWGVTFDDGPSPYTPQVLNYLKSHSLSATFFVVGSSAYWEPNMVTAEYAAGHQVAVHTWRHPYLTTLSNEEIVAELGWSREIIRDLTGVTPKFMRPPYGDIDDRVRAIALAMGLQPVIWTRDPTTKAQYDTNDWRIPAGQSTGPASYAQFQQILNNATQLNTGFIVLEHDLYEQTVELAVGYTLDSALHFNPPFTLKNIVGCQNLAIEEAYNETASKPVPQLQTTWSGQFVSLGSTANSSSGGTGSSGGSGGGSSGGGSGGGNGAVTIGLSVGVGLAGFVAAFFGMAL